MKIPQAPVNPWVEVPLFGPPAVALVFEILLEVVEETAVLSLMGHDPQTGKLIEFRSRKVEGFGNIEEAVRESGREFTAILRSHTAPFT